MMSFPDVNSRPYWYCGYGKYKDSKSISKSGTGEWSAGSRSWVDLETPRCFPDPSFKGCIDAGGRRLDL